MVVKNVQTALDIDFQRRRHMTRFRFVLRQQCIVEVFQHRHGFGTGVLKVRSIDFVDAAVNDRFLHRLQPLFAADYKFAKGKNKIGFQSQRIIFLGIVCVDVHGVDILGAGRADMDDLPMQTFHQWSILRLRIAHKNIVIRDEKSIANFSLCAERLARAGSAQNQTVGVFQLFTVHHNQVIGQGVQTVVQAFLTVVEQLLRSKRHKNCRAAGGQSPLNFDLTVCQRQAAHQPLLLLKIQPAQFAVVLLGNADRLKHVGFQFLLGLAGVQHQKRDEEHPLVLTLQFFQQGFCIPPISRQIGRQHVHVVSGADGFFLFLNL